MELAARAKAIGAQGRPQLPAVVDDGKPTKHAEASVCIERQWWRIQWRGYEWLVLFSEAVDARRVGAWCYRQAYDGAIVSHLNGWPEGYGKA